MRYNEFLKEDEYGRDQGALNEPDMLSEEDFIELAKEWGTAPEDQPEAGEGTGDDVVIDGNTVIIRQFTNRKMGELKSLGGNILAMYEEGNGELVGVIIRETANMYNVFHYVTGYEGTNKTIEAALDTLIIARWG